MNASLEHAGPAAAQDWRGRCLELAIEVMEANPGAQALWVELHPRETTQGWWYHVIPLIDGKTHCAWFPDRITTPRKYIRQTFNSRAVLNWSIVDAPKELHSRQKLVFRRD